MKPMFNISYHDCLHADFIQTDWQTRLSDCYLKMATNIVCKGHGEDVNFAKSFRNVRYVLQGYEHTEVELYENTETSDKYMLFCLFRGGSYMPFNDNH